MIIEDLLAVQKAHTRIALQGRIEPNSIVLKSFLYDSSGKFALIVISQPNLIAHVRYQSEEIVEVLKQCQADVVYIVTGFVTGAEAYENKSGEWEYVAKVEATGMEELSAPMEEKS